MAWDEAVWAVDEVKGKIAQAGYPPKAMSMINIVDAGGGVVNLYFKPPANTYLRDQADGSVPLVTVGGVEIRKKAGTHIASRTDGDRFMIIPASDMNNYVTTPIVDDDVEIGTTYCYRFFPFSTLGTYNDQDTSEHAVEVTQEGHMLIYGFDQDFRDLNPDTQITYPDDVINENYEPMLINEALGEATSGGWEHFLVNVLRNAPYMVKRNGEADYELDHGNYKLKIDGTDSDWDNANYQGMPMAWLQNVYKKEWYTEEGNVRHVRFCEGVPINEDPDDWRPTCYGLDGEAKKGIFIPIGAQKIITFSSEDRLTHITAESYNDQKYNNINLVYGDNPAHYFDIPDMVLQANGFCNNSDISSENAFSTLYGGEIVAILRDYLYMMLKTTNLKVNTYNTESPTEDFNIDSDYSSIPGFCGAANKACRLFYSYMIMGYKQLNIIDLYDLECYGCGTSFSASTANFKNANYSFCTTFYSVGFFNAFVNNVYNFSKINNLYNNYISDIYGDTFESNSMISMYAQVRYNQTTGLGSPSITLVNIFSNDWVNDQNQGTPYYGYMTNYSSYGNSSMVHLNNLKKDISQKLILDNFSGTFGAEIKLIQAQPFAGYYMNSGYTAYNIEVNRSDIFWPRLDNISYRFQTNIDNSQVIGITKQNEIYYNSYVYNHYIGYHWGAFNNGNSGYYIQGSYGGVKYDPQYFNRTNNINDISEYDFNYYNNSGSYSLGLATSFNRHAKEYTYDNFRNDFYINLPKYGVYYNLYGNDNGRVGLKELFVRGKYTILGRKTKDLGIIEVTYGMYDGMICHTNVNQNYYLKLGINQYVPMGNSFGTTYPRNMAVPSWNITYDLHIDHNGNSSFINSDARNPRIGIIVIPSNDYTPY